MSTKIGRFSVISQLAESSFATVYKALNPDTRQTFALKVVLLPGLRDAASLIKAVREESERAGQLASPNIAALYEVGEEDGKLLIASEYVQGNPVAAMLARQDGFTIWDIEDITRQVCQALDHARFHKAVHRSLEAAKVMVQWDGTVKVLGFGSSSVSAHALDSPTVPELLHYASPEQLLGEVGDHRMALFSLGAILYEMATEQEAFPGKTREEVRAQIIEGTPPLPHQLKAKLSPGLSALIMRALSKSPADRYQSGQELLRDLEQAKAAVNPVPGKKAKARAAVAGRDLSAKAVEPGTGDSSRSIAASSVTAAQQSKPGFKVDPAMVKGDSVSPAPTRSFSDVSELPPLKYLPGDEAQATEEAADSEPLPPVALKGQASKTPRGQVREKAQKAMAEIRKTPPRLYLYATAAALFLIMLAAAAMLLENRMEDQDEVGEAASRRPTVSAGNAPIKPAPAEPSVGAPSPQAEAAAPEPARPVPEVTEVLRKVKPAAVDRRERHSPPPATAAQLTISSVPADAGISFDGRLLCQSPCTLTDIPPGRHVVLAARDGYSSESRTLALSAGVNSSLSIQLNTLPASLSVQSTPAGAAIEIDGEATGKFTPSEFTLSQAGVHTVLLKRRGYLEGTSSINTQLGRTASVNLSLQPLGTTEKIRPAGGKFKHLLDRGDHSTMGIVSVKTQPKGAQIMVNDRVLDKTAPFDFYLNPGAYLIDISLAGYRPVHRVIRVEQLEKVAIEEALAPE